MFTKDSRYASNRLLETGPEGEGPFPGVRARQIQTLEGVVEHRVRDGDRLDLLARHYYNNDRLWPRILDANPELLYGGDAVLAADTSRPSPDVPLTGMVGRTILIPGPSA